MTTRFALVLTLLLPWAPLPLYPQVSLTGAILFSTDSNGNATSQRWHTMSGETLWDLWLALEPNASLPVNGPSDAQAGIDLPLQAGQSYTYYVFSQPNGGYSFDALNLFFDGNNNTPGISVFGPIDSSSFRPNNGSTWTLAGASEPGSGASFYSANGVTVVLNGFNWNNPAAVPGDVCQSYAFTPAAGDILSYFGSFNLQVWQAASLSLSQTGGPPGTTLTTTGAGYLPGEMVSIYLNQIGKPYLTTAAGADGSFTITTAEPQAPYGPVGIFAVGLESSKLGAAPYFVSAAMVTMPRAGLPGSTITARALGFGAGETIDVYWNQPYQLLGTAAADGRGTGTLTFTIPANAPKGPNKLVGIGQSTGAQGYGGVWVK